MDYLVAFGLCVAAVLVESLCAGRDPMGQLRRIRQPSWSPPTWAWVLIGLAWYGICFAGLARLLALWPDSRLAVILLAVLMLMNAAVNLLQFRLKRLDLTLLFFIPYWLVLGWFMATAWPLDRTTFILFAVYAAYQLYAAVWGYQLWRLNRP